MDFSKIKVIKELGAGMWGTVYLINYKNKKYAMKVQKILEEEKVKNPKFPIWRELLFYRDVNKMPLESKKFFCQLHGFKIEICGKYRHIRPKNVPNNSIFVEKFKELNASNICAILVIDYLGSNSLENYLLSNPPAKKIYSILLQICKINQILVNMKYSHNDLKPANLMMTPTKDKTFDIMAHKIPYSGFQLVAIDYGNMTNASYGRSLSNDSEEYYFLELTKTIFSILQNVPKLEKNCRLQKKKFPNEIKKKYQDNIWIILFEKYGKIVDEYAEKYLRLYPHLISFYSELKKNNKIPTGSNKNEIGIFLLKILNNYALDHSEEFAKISGWCSPPEFTLPKKDVLEILGCKTREDYVNLFMKKI
jgi:serine/threonine protein kinase